MDVQASPATVRLKARLDINGDIILDILQTILKLRPMVHDSLCAKVSQGLRHRILRVFAIVAANVGDDGDTSTNRGKSARLAVLDGNSLSSRLADLFKSIQVDSGVGLRGGLRQRAGSAEDLVLVKELVLTDVLDGSENATQSGRGHDCQTVLLLRENLLQLLGGTDTGLSLSIQLGDDFVLFLRDVFLQFLCIDLEVVLLLEGDHHATEVLANKVLDELLAGVTVGEVIGLQNLIGQVGTGLEGQLL